MRLIIPSAGLGTRTQTFFEGPKPLIEINGSFLLELVLQTMPWNQVEQLIIVLNEKHNSWFDSRVKGRLLSAIPGEVDTTILFTPTTTGQAETASIALGHRPEANQAVLIGNCDTLVGGDWPDFSKIRDGALGLFTSKLQNLSYAKLNADGEVVQTAEKQVISNLASSGLYFFSRASDFMNALDSARLFPGEQFIAPLYNDLISRGMSISHWMHDTVTPLGTESEIRSFLEGPDDEA